jgi:hypothetical protein
VVDEPVRIDSLRASGGHDFIEDVRDAGLEILRRLVLEYVTCALMRAILSRH